MTGPGVDPRTEPVPHPNGPGPGPASPTTPIPVTGGAAPVGSARWDPDDVRPGPPAPPRRGPAVRALGAVAGVLSAGLLVLGVGLLAAQLLAPSVAGSTDLGRGATGPGWDRVLVTLLGAVVAEAVRWTGRRRAPGLRALLDGLVVAGVLVVLWWGWWR